MIKRITRVIRQRGVVGLLDAIVTRTRYLFPKKARSFQGNKHLFSGKTGIEIGGTSQVFSRSGLFPVYPIVGHLDNCNFGKTTVWEGNIQEGQAFKFDNDKPAGRQYIAEATFLGFLASDVYDFVLSSHMLEHTANPILALSEWLRILKEEGVLAMLLPHKDGTFDHRRPVTTMAHMIEDFNVGMTEDDLTHMPEILALHDLSLDPAAGDFAAFKHRSLSNAENRCFHQHVFDAQLVIQLANYMGLQIQAVETIRPYHILILAKKMRMNVSPDNKDYISQSAEYRRVSPFPTDHL